MAQEQLDNIITDFVEKETVTEDTAVSKTEEITENDNQPFKVYESQEEFDKHAKGIRKSAEDKILKSLGFDSIESLQEKLKGKPLEVEEKSTEPEKSEETVITPQVSQVDTKLTELEMLAESLQEELNNKRIENKLLASNVSQENIDYVMLDLIKNNIDIDNEEQFKSFIDNSKFKGKDVSFNPKQETINIEELAMFNANNK